MLTYITEKERDDTTIEILLWGEKQHCNILHDTFDTQRHINHIYSTGMPFSG
jgi:hypothetical protein